MNQINKIDTILKKIHELSLCALSHVVIYNQPYHSQNICSDIRNYYYRHHDLYQQFLAKSFDKVHFFSILVDSQFANQMQDLLVNVADLLIANDCTSNWHSKLFTSTNSDHSLTLMNLFLVNNNKPYILFLGYDFISEFSDLADQLDTFDFVNSYRQTVKDLCQPVVSVINAAPHSIYQKQLINTTKHSDQLVAKLNKLLDQNFKPFVEKFISTNTTDIMDKFERGSFTSDNSFYGLPLNKSAINCVTLDNLIQYLIANKAIVPKTIYRDYDNLMDMNNLSINEDFQKILTYILS